MPMDVREILSLAAFDEARREITSWPGYQATPLRRLSKLAAAAGVGEIYYKDEAAASASAASRRSAAPTRYSSCCGRQSANEAGATASSHDLTSGQYADHNQANHGDMRDRRQSWPLGRVGRTDIRLPLRDLRARNRQRRPLPRHRRLWRRGPARRRHLRRCGAACRRRRRGARLARRLRHGPTRATPTFRAT